MQVSVSPLQPFRLPTGELDFSALTRSGRGVDSFSVSREVLTFIFTMATILIALWI